MPEVGVRELKVRASEIVRDLRDRGTRYIITYRGRPVGVLVPLEEARLSETSGSDPWAELVRLGEEIGQGWRSPLTGAELLSGMRR